MHLAITALSALQGLLAVQILHVIRADGIDSNIFSVGVHSYLFHKCTDCRWSDIFKILRSSWTEMQCKQQNFWMMRSQFHLFSHFMSSLFSLLIFSAATKLLIAPVVLLLVVVVGALALVIGNIILCKNTQAHLSDLSSAESSKQLIGLTALHIAAEEVYVYAKWCINAPNHALTSHNVVVVVVGIHVAPLCLLN